MTDSTTGSSRGTLGVGPDGSFQIQFVRNLHHSPEKVWQWLTDPELLQRWLPGCTIDARRGGAVSFDFGEEGAATGEVRSVSGAGGGPKELQHTWVWEGVPTSLVTWRLEPQDGGALLTLTHRELIEEPAREFALGWHMMLDSLQLDLEGRPTDAAWETAEKPADIYLPG